MILSPAEVDSWLGVVDHFGKFIDLVGFPVVMALLLIWELDRMRKALTDELRRVRDAVERAGCPLPREDKGQ